MRSDFDLSNSFSDLSIVLQGPAELEGRSVAAMAARTARQAFPRAEVIISCWDGDRTEAIRALVDKLVVSPDPGPQRHSAGILNVNRQIVSSKAGCDAATRPFVLKARSDLFFRDARIWTEYLTNLQRFRKTQRREPILITNLTTVNPSRQERYFALCDWIYLGPRDLVCQLFEAPLFPDDYLGYPVNGDLLLRFNAEQWIALNYLGRHGLDLNTLPNGYDTKPATALAHRELVGSHFALSSWFRLGLGTQKHRISSFSLNNMYTQQEWAEEFFGHRSFLDPERMVISVAYHPLVRAIAKRLLRPQVV